VNTESLPKRVESSFYTYVLKRAVGPRRGDRCFLADGKKKTGHREKADRFGLVNLGGGAYVRAEAMASSEKYAEGKEHHIRKLEVLKAVNKTRRGKKNPRGLNSP